MKSQYKEKIKYKSDVVIKQIRMNIFTVISYIGLVWLWHFVLSYQSSLYTLMNIGVLLMFSFGALGCIVSKEDRENIIKHTKSQIATYLIIVFVYELFLKAVINDIPTNSSDPSLTTAKNFLTIVSTMMKVGFPLAYIVWMLQKFAVYRKGIAKQRQIEILRDVRKSATKSSKDKLKREKDNFNTRF